MQSSKVLHNYNLTNHKMLKIFKQFLLVFILFFSFSVVFNSSFVFAEEKFDLIHDLEKYRPNNLPYEDELQQSERNKDGTSDIYAVGGVQAVLVGIINIVLYIAGTIAVIAIIVSGAQYIFSFGSEQTETAKKNIIWALAGLLIVMLSYVLVQNIIRILVDTSS